MQVEVVQSPAKKGEDIKLQILSLLCHTKINQITREGFHSLLPESNA